MSIYGMDLNNLRKIIKRVKELIFFMIMLLKLISYNINLCLETNIMQFYVIDLDQLII